MTDRALAPTKTSRGAWGQFALYIVLTVGAIISFAPFFWMISSAFKQPAEIRAYPPVWISRSPTMDNIIKIWGELDFSLYFRNSLILSITPTVIILFTSALVGYVLAKVRFPGSNIVFLSVLATMMIPYPVTLIPRFQMMIWFGWMDSYRAIIIPGFYSSFGIFLVRQFMDSIPDDLLDAGRIDGAAELRIFLQLILPLMKPVLAALGIFQFMWSWNDFLWPLLILNTQDKFSLPLAIAAFTSENIVDYGATMAGAAISVAPVLIVFLFLQKYFVSGVAMTGIKG